MRPFRKIVLITIFKFQTCQLGRDYRLTHIVGNEFHFEPLEPRIKYSVLYFKNVVSWVLESHLSAIFPQLRTAVLKEYQCAIRTRELRIKMQSTNHKSNVMKAVRKKRTYTKHRVTGSNAVIKYLCHAGARAIDGII